MAAVGPREPARDLYQLLGVARDASREEIALAWRRRARDEHPGQHPGRIRITARHSPAAPGPGATGSTAPPTGASGPPLVAGPVRVEGGSRQVPRAGAWDEEGFRLALLAELVLRYHGRGWPW
jgi:hypothetical protein